MNQTPHLTKAPIKEALIDIQGSFTNAKNYDEILRELELIHAEFEGEFPIKDVRTAREVLFHGAQSPIVNDTKVGFLFKSRDQKKIVQFRINGFTLSHLNHYQNWDSLIKDTQKYWKLFNSKRSDFKISRLAVRFINQIQIPWPCINKSDYLLRMPNTPSGSEADELHSFAEQVSWSNKASGCQSNLIIFMAEQSNDSVEKTITIDIDTFRNIQVNNLTDDKVWELINAFQSIKNDIFYSLVGKKTIERYR